MSPGALLGLAGFALYLAAIVILQRAARGSAALVVVAAAVTVFVGAPLAALVAGARFNAWDFVAVYSCLTLGFLMLFGAVYKSVSLRMLDFLLAQPGRSAAAHALERRYVADESFGHRLEVIERSRFAKREGGGFVLTPKGRAIAGAVRGLHAFFAIERIG